MSWGRRRPSRGGYGGWGPAEFYQYERTTPLPADGIKAKAQRGQFGKTWWAGRWLAALERLVDAGRLSRGRSYARSGQVLSLDVGREGVTARVQGSRPTPYQVTLHFARLGDAEWERVVDALAGQAIFSARLLNGEMPESIEEVFAATGTSLFPATGADLATECTCPDWSNPCKHIAAVYYLLGERFDADPFVLFELRGRSQAEIAAGLRQRRAGTLAPADGPAPEAEATASAAQPELDAAPEPEPPVPLLGDSLAAFWTLPAEVANQPARFEPPVVDGLPVKRLGTPAFWPDQRPFGEVMAQVYRHFSRDARRRVFGREADR